MRFLGCRHHATCQKAPEDAGLDQPPGRRGQQERTDDAVAEELRSLPRQRQGEGLSVGRAGRVLVSSEGVGEKVLALQFHLEADYQRIERWLVGHAGELSAAGIDPTTIREDARRYGPRLAVAAGAVFNGWLDGVALGD